MLVQSYGPQIRGGESAVVLRIGEREMRYEGDDTDLLRLLPRQRPASASAARCGCTTTACVILEEKDDERAARLARRARARPAYRHPFATFENGVEVAGEPKNMKALALRLPRAGLARVAGRAGAARALLATGPALVERNMPTFRRGATRPTDVPALPRITGHGVPLVVETGNEAVARGAMAAGLRFFAGYPITPSSEIMETLIDELPAARRPRRAGRGRDLRARHGGRRQLRRRARP